MAGVLLLRDRLRVARLVWKISPDVPDFHLTYECLDVDCVASGGHVADPKDRHREPEILRLAKPLLGKVPDARART
jgi:hypothetical protein